MMATPYAEGEDEHKEQQRRYQAECDLRSLVEAQKIRSDKSRIDAAMKIADEQRSALKGLKKDNHNAK